MLVELAFGDSYGAGFEYATPDFVRQHNKLTGYVQNPTHPDLRPGCYTDDTQMSIAVAEVILSNKVWSRELLADRFVAVYKRDPRPGYATGFRGLLESVQDGKDLLARIRSKSDKSGGAMRAVPIGLLTEDDVVECAKMQASVTHDTPEGRAAAAAAAMLGFAARHWCPLAEIADYIDSRVPSFGECCWRKPWTGPVGSKGWMSVRAAITAVSRNRSLALLLKDCVDFSGDVDTVAAIALGAASLHPAYARDLPQLLHDGLENGPYGRDFLQDMDRKILETCR